MFFPILFLKWPVSVSDSEQTGGGFLSSVNSGCKYILKAIRQSIFIFAHNKLQAQNWWHKVEGYSLRLHATSA